jgi:hypothetical protein
MSRSPATEERKERSGRRENARTTSLSIRTRRKRKEKGEELE